MTSKDLDEQLGSVIVIYPNSGNVDFLHNGRVLPAVIGTGAYELCETVWANTAKKMMLRSARRI